jgi:hypothetical protein
MAQYGMQILQAAAYAVTAVAAVRSAQSEEMNANAQADALNYNAKALDNQAVTAWQQANASEEAHRRRARQQEGALRASLNQTGTAGGTGVGVLEQSSVNAELDALNLRYEGQVKAVALEDEAKLNRYQAVSERIRGKNAKRGGYLSAASSLLGNFAGDYSSGKFAKQGSKG